MNARLISWLVAGSVVFAGGQIGFISGSVPVPESASNGIPSVVAANLESYSDSALVSIHIPGFAGKPVVEVIETPGRPGRLVVDLHGVNRGTVPRADITRLARSPLISDARLAQNQPEPMSVTRLVLEVVPGVKAVVSSEPHGIDITLSRGTGKIQASLKESSLPSIPKAFDSPVLLASNNNSTSLPPLKTVSADHTDGWEKLPIETFERLPQIGAPYIGLPMLGSMPVVSVATANVTNLESSVAPKYINQQNAQSYSETGAKKYVGTPMTVSVNNAELRFIVSMLVQNSNLSLVFDPDANSGGWTYDFDQVPWDQILENVVVNAGLAMDINDNVLRIAKVEKLKKEADDRKAMEDAKMLAGDLVTETRPLSYAKADEVMKILTNVKSSRGTIYIDPRTNLIFMNDLPRYVETMQKLMDKLDIKVPQVQIEARIVEANKGWEKAFGTSWPQSNGGNSNLTVGGQAAAWGAQNSPSWNSINNRSDGGNVATAAFSPGKPGATDIVGAAGELWVSFLTNRISFNAIIQALESSNQIKVVSEPKLTAPNNETAHIADGSRIPYQSNQGGAIGGAITVSFVEAELRLQVKPQITNDGNILLEVELEKGQPDFGNHVNGTPTILRKQLKTTIFVHDGGTAVLGGVFTNSLETGSTGVPFFSKLPGLGWLFRNKTSHDKTTEMLVLISPKILDY
ncbi:MAG: type IV pilus secretin PilQ [Holophagaceae bacterium]|nr:type IV pilus secretin PilQ [Holophagaceae bacterium]